MRAHFRATTPLLDAELATIAESPFSGAATFLLFEYDASDFGEAFAVTAWPMSKAGDPTAERHALLKGKAVAVPREIYDDPKYEDLDCWHLASRLLERWFVDRWKHLRKKHELCPAVIGHHDSYFKTDLKTGERVKWDDVLEAAGTKPRTRPAKAKPRKKA